MCIDVCMCVYVCGWGGDCVPVPVEGKEVSGCVFGGEGGERELCAGGQLTRIYVCVCVCECVCGAFMCLCLSVCVYACAWVSVFTGESIND